MTRGYRVRLLIPHDFTQQSDSVDVVPQDYSQIIRWHFRALFRQEAARPLRHPPKPARRGNPELRQIFARRLQLAAQTVGGVHVVDRPQIDPRAVHPEILQRREKRVLAGAQCWQMKEVDASALSSAQTIEASAERNQLIYWARMDPTTL